jgi:hypothetical protein
MSRWSDLLSDDTNQFGPGTDLTLSLLAVLLVIAMIATHEYHVQKANAEDIEQRFAEFRNSIPPPPPPAAPKPAEDTGNFKPASEYFTAADFYPYPVTRLRDPRGVKGRIGRIVSEYRRLESEYPYIFVIGHSSRVDELNAVDRTDEARRKRNLEYALRRSALISGLMQEELDANELERLIAVSTGEADLRDAQRPLAQENAWVEVMFAKEWKPSIRTQAH